MAIRLARNSTICYNTHRVMTPKHIVAVIDYGSQYTQLIVRRVREREAAPEKHRHEVMGRYEQYKARKS